MIGFNKAGGVVVDGLKNRRKKEAIKFQKGWKNPCVYENEVEKGEESTHTQLWNL